MVYNSTETHEIKNRIGSLDGLKAIALLMIFFEHMGFSILPFHAISRCVEFFFVTSGFLFFYTQREKFAKDSFNSAYSAFLSKKIRQIYPIYLWGWLYFAILSKPDFFLSATNLLMLQTWSLSSEVCFSMNGPSWYIAALMFCYLCAPLLLKVGVIEKQPVLLICGLAGFRLFLEVASVHDAWLLPIAVHTSPILRLIDFIFGMISCNTFLKMKIKITDRKEIFTFLEMTGLTIFFLLDVLLDNLLPKTFFSVLSAIVICIFANNQGWISKLFCSVPFCWFSKIQLEFYLFSAVASSIGVIITTHLFPEQANTHSFEIGITLIILVIGCVIYRKLVSRLLNHFYRVVDKKKGIIFNG